MQCPVWIHSSKFFIDNGSSHTRSWIQKNSKIGPVLEITVTYLHDKHGAEFKILFLSENHTQSWGIKQSITIQKSLKISVKNKRFNGMWRILHTDQRQKQKNKERNLSHLSSIKFSKKWFIFFVIPTNGKKKWNDSFLDNQRKFSESFPTNSSFVWQSMDNISDCKRKNEKEMSILYLCFKNKLLSFKFSLQNIQNAISLILHCRTMLWFRANSSSTFIMSDVRLMFILSSTLD